MELVADEPDYQVPFLSGYFRDRMRRIDMVLVSKDTGEEELESMKTTFLMNVINMGLDVEIEAGVGEKYSDLNFIKLHAPERVLQHFGIYYNIKKVFKSSHLELIRCGIFEEKEMIKIIRRWYPNLMFSTFERSQIVYKMLTSVTFGQPENYVGIHQMIENKILLDIFPLHDGPKHLVRGQTILQMNGRQALFYNWCGYRNLFRQMPLNLIREYLGEKIGFFFAFYQFYNCFLFLLGVLGIYIFSKNYDIKGRNVTINEYGMLNFVPNMGRPFKYYDIPVCPKCRDWVACPIRMLSYYQRELLFKVYLDNPFVYYMAFATVVWGILLYLLWRRIENYWYWMWEVNEEDARSLTRPEFRLVGRKCNWQLIYRRPIEFAVLLLAIIVIVILYPGLMLEVYLKMLNKLRYVEEAGRAMDSKYAHATDPTIGFHAIERINHFVVVVIGSMNGIFILGMEMLWNRIAKFLNWAYEPRSEWLYEKRYIYNTFIVVVLINSVVVSFYAHVKGALYAHPTAEENWDYPLQLGMLHCGVLYCLDEIFLVYVATFKTKLFCQQVMRSLTLLPHDKQKDPEKFDPPKFDRTPCWEREMNLLPLNEDVIHDMYLKLFVQMAVVTFFSSVFPLAPIIAFLWNLWNMGYLAKLLVVHSRRPLLLQTWGIGPWHKVLYLMPFIACFTNIIYVVRNNSFLDRRFSKRHWGYRDKHRFLVDYFMSFYMMADHVANASMKYNAHYYKNFSHYLMPFCIFPGQYNYYPNQKKYFMPMAGNWAIPWRQTLCVLLFWMLCTAVFFLLTPFIAPVSKKVRETRRIEDAVRGYSMKRVPEPTVKRSIPAETQAKRKERERKKVTR